eukprot:345881_1
MSTVNNEETVSLLQNHENETEPMIEIVIVNWDYYLQNCVDDFLIEQHSKHHNENKFSELSQIRLRHLFPKWYWQKWENDVLNIFTSTNFIHDMQLTSNNMNIQYYKGSMKLIVDILIEYIDAKEIKKQIDTHAYNAICKHLLSTTNIRNINDHTKLYSFIECILFAIIVILKIYHYHFTSYYYTHLMQNICSIFNAIIIAYHCYLKLRLMYNQHDLLSFLKDYKDYYSHRNHSNHTRTCDVLDNFTTLLISTNGDIEVMQKWRDKYNKLQLIVVHMMLSAIVWLLSFNEYLQLFMFVMLQIITNILAVSVVLKSKNDKILMRNLESAQRCMYVSALFILISYVNIMHSGILLDIRFLNVAWVSYFFMVVSGCILWFLCASISRTCKQIGTVSSFEHIGNSYMFFAGQFAILLCLFIIFLIGYEIFMENIYIEFVCLWIYFILGKMMSLFLLYPTAFCWNISVHRQWGKSVLWMLLYPMWWNFAATKYH